jgi:ComEC/Rec2-related protein
MGILLVLTPRLGRLYNIYTAMALAALLMSLFDPFVLWDPGFQLSFLGTLGIILLTPPFQRLLHPIARLPLGHFIIEINAVTLAAQIATLPILALNFNQISFIAPIVNMLTVPLLGTVIFIGILMCVAGMLFAPLGILCGWVAWPVLWYIDHIVTWCAEIPYAYRQVSSLNSGLAWCYYALLSLQRSVRLYKWPGKAQEHHTTVPPLLSRRTWRILQLSAALLVILATGATVLAAQPGGRLTITFLNVAPANQPPQGEAILLNWTQ